jgi:hypothetical protein
MYHIQGRCGKVHGSVLSYSLVEGKKRVVHSMQVNDPFINPLMIRWIVTKRQSEITFDEN